MQEKAKQGAFAKLALSMYQVANNSYTMLYELAHKIDPQLIRSESELDPERSEQPRQVNVNTADTGEVVKAVPELYGKLVPELYGELNQIAKVMQLNEKQIHKILVFLNDNLGDLHLGGVDTTICTKSGY